MAKSWETNWHNKQPLGTKSGQKNTYTVQNKQDGRQAILQTLKNNKDSQSRARFFREVFTLSLLNAAKAAVPEVYEHNSDETNDAGALIYLVAEFIPGETLAKLLERGPLPVEKAVAICRQLAKTLEVAFKEEIVHRDLKPDNIIVRDFGSADVVTIDFGLSYHPDDDQGTVTRVGETFRNKYLDLPETNAPGGDMRDKRSDITALCAILFSCLTGCQRIGHLQDSTGLLPHMRPGQRIADRLKENPQSQGLVRFFNRGLTPQVDLRFQNLDEFLASISLALDGDANSSPEDPIEIAKQVSQRLRTSNPKVIAHSYILTCQKIVNETLQYYHHNANNFSDFHLAALGGDTQIELPATCTRVDVVPATVRLQPKGVNIFLQVSYYFAAEGTQCAVFRKHSRLDEQGNLVGELNVQRVLVFEHADEPKEVATKVVADFKRWIGNSIQELERLL